MDLALATCRDLPDLDPDDRPLVPALAAHGIVARPVVWNDPAFDWTRPRACLLRSTWDYHRDRDAFVAWADRVALRTPLFNPAHVVRWNTHKRYLRDLEARGVRIVPTVWVAAGARIDLERALAERGWDDAVVKPAVSANAETTTRVGVHVSARAQAALDAVTARGDAMVQPYLASVEGRGEISLVHIEGAFSHAVRKRAVLATGAHGERGEREPRAPEEPAVDASADERRFAEGALAAVGERLLYARVDVARDARGELVLMELELVEPTLFLQRGGARATERLAAAVAARVAALP